MTDGMAVDTSTMLVLAAIALTEGIARVPAGSLVLRRWLNGPWRVAGPPPSRDRLQLVHWWPPWTDTLVVPPRSGNALPIQQIELLARLNAVSPMRRAARILGAVSLLALVIGIPAAFGLAGAVGGLSAAGVMLGSQAILGLFGWRGLTACGATPQERRRLLVSVLNPFAAPGVGSGLLAVAAHGASPLTVAHTLLEPEYWAAWFRRRAYDAGVAQKEDRGLAQELAVVDDLIAQVLARRPPMEPDVRWCPRCAATYQSRIALCTDCGVTLLGAGETVSPSVPRQ
jgi:hypothetical protein